MTVNVDSQLSTANTPVNTLPRFTLPTNPNGITNVDQGLYHNAGPNISNIPYLNLAFNSNVSSRESPDVSIALNPMSLTWCDFLDLFFKSPSEGFCISQSNAHCKAISFYTQHYESTENKNKKFKFFGSLLKQM